MNHSGTEIPAPDETLTFKSIRVALRNACDAGELVAWEPVIEGDRVLRTLLISKEIEEELDPDTWIDEELRNRYPQLLADFDRYISGDTIPVGMHPYDKDESAFMARIDPTERGVWSIRSVAPKPALRVLGCFAGIDIFVALKVYVRRDLGGPGDRRWDNARENTLSRWNNLFPGHAPLAGDDLNDFFKEKAVIVEADRG